MSNIDSPQVKLIRNYGRGFTEKDPDISAKTLLKDSRHIVYPKSLNIPGQSGKEHLDYIGERIGHWVDDEPLIIETIADTPGKVVAHVTHKAKTKSGSAINFETIFIAQIVTDTDGSLKIKQTEVFIDSKTYLELEAARAASAKK